MCLTIKPFTRKLKAKTDITVYKILSRYAEKSVDGDCVISPIRNFPYIIGKEYTANLDTFSIFNRLSVTVSPYNHLEVNKGIHSFLEDDPKVRYKLFSINYNHYRYEGVGIIDYFDLYQCTIPQGSYYYEGVWGRHRIPSIASSRLVVNKALLKMWIP